MKKIKIPAILDNLDAMIDFITDGFAEAGLDQKYKQQVHLACEEALVNVISYAYPDKTGDVEISTEISSEKGTLFIQFADSGVEFNPLEKAEPDLNIPLEERGTGGLGVYMYKIIMDEVTYERTEGKNVLSFIRRLKT